MLNSLLFPFFYLGVVTYILGFIIKSPLLVCLSIFNISGCSEDLIMFNFIRKLKNIEYTEFDNPTSFALFTDEDLSKYNPLGLKYKKAQDTVPRNDLKKIEISKWSIIIFIGLILLTIITLNKK